MFTFLSISYFPQENISKKKEKSPFIIARVFSNCPLISRIFGMTNNSVQGVLNYIWYCLPLYCALLLFFSSSTKRHNRKSFARHVLSTAELNVLFLQRDRKLKVNYEINSKKRKEKQKDGYTCAQHINAQFSARPAHLTALEGKQ